MIIGNFSVRFRRIARIVLIPASTSAGDTDDTNQPSPSRPVRRSAASLLPPIQIGRPFFCHGRGMIVASSTRKIFSIECHVFFRPQAGASRRSSRRCARRVLFCLRRPPVNLSTPRHRDRSPEKNGPCERKSRVASSLARTIGIARRQNQRAGAELHLAQSSGNVGKKCDQVRESAPLETNRSLTQSESTSSASKKSIRLENRFGLDVATRPLPEL